MAIEPASPKGFHCKISLGSTVSAAIRAISIAAAVNTPKYIVGMKLENTRMEKPMMMVMVV